jgi:hypothetical protein
MCVHIGRPCGGAAGSETLHTHKSASSVAVDPSDATGGGRARISRAVLTEQGIEGGRSH